MASTRAQKRASRNYRKRNKQQIKEYDRLRYLETRKEPSRPYIPKHSKMHDLYRLQKFIAEDLKEMIEEGKINISALARKYHCPRAVMKIFLEDIEPWLS